MQFREKLTEANMEVTVRKEDGCEAYYYISHPENDTIVLTERWASKEAQQEHLTKPHMEIVKALKDEYVVSTEVIQEMEFEFEVSK
jgi:quinol monooxygenase YgiN